MPAPQPDLNYCNSLVHEGSYKAENQQGAAGVLNEYIMREQS